MLSIFQRRSKRNAQIPAPPPRPAAYQPRYSERDARTCVPVSRRPESEQNKFKHVNLGDDPTLSKGKRNGMFVGRSNGKGKGIEGSSSSGRSLISDLDAVPELLEPPGQFSGYHTGESGELNWPRTESGGSHDAQPGPSKPMHSRHSSYHVDMDACINMRRGNESGDSLTGGVHNGDSSLPDRGPVSTLPPVVEPHHTTQSDDVYSKPSMDQERRDTRTPDSPDEEVLAELYDTISRYNHRAITFQILNGTVTAESTGDSDEAFFSRSIPPFHGLRRERRYWSHRTCIPRPGKDSGFADMMPQLQALGNSPDSPAGAPPTPARNPPIANRWSSSAATASAEDSEKSGSENETQVSGAIATEVKSVRMKRFSRVKKLWL